MFQTFFGSKNVFPLQGGVTLGEFGINNIYSYNNDEFTQNKQYKQRYRNQTEEVKNSKYQLHF